jgi:hypothetical protein
MIESNKNNSVLRVQHRKLKRISDNSVYRSECPICPDKSGALLMSRNVGGNLKRTDSCFTCGQRFYYTDIKENQFGLEYWKINI